MNSLRVEQQGAAGERILVLDGAMGTMIQGHRLKRPTSAATVSVITTTP